jgi:hypothetical protein
MPAIHKWWQPTLPQRSRSASSLAAAAAENTASVARRLRPSPLVMTGSYATCGPHCSVCNQELFNGGCARCTRDRACRTWGECLRTSEPAVVAMHAAQVISLPLAKRDPKDQRKKSKLQRYTQRASQECPLPLSQCPRTRTSYFVPTDVPITLSALPTDLSSSRPTV